MVNLVAFGFSKILQLLLTLPSLTRTNSPSLLLLALALPHLLAHVFMLVPTLPYDQIFGTISPTSAKLLPILGCL